MKNLAHRKTGCKSWISITNDEYLGWKSKIFYNSKRPIKMAAFSNCMNSYTNFKSCFPMLPSLLSFVDNQWISARHFFRFLTFRKDLELLRFCGLHSNFRLVGKPISLGNPLALLSSRRQLQPRCRMVHQAWFFQTLLVAGRSAFSKKCRSSYGIWLASLLFSGRAFFESTIFWMVRLCESTGIFHFDFTNALTWEKASWKSTRKWTLSS